MKSKLSPQERSLLGQATVSMPGTCGELVQGMLDGIFFHVTCPVDLYSSVSVELYHGPEPVSGPADCPKAVEAVRRTLSYLSQAEMNARLKVCSPLPRGKGMASSTADVAAAVEATVQASGKSLSAEAVAGIALAVEPSDGIMLPGIAAFDHRQGRLIELLGQPPPIDILVLDFGGVVDTLEFNSVDHRHVLRQTESQAREALELVRQGVQRGDLTLVGQAATISAITSQKILYKPQLEPVLDIARAAGAVGVNVAHSGTVLGVLLDARQPTAEAARGILKRISEAVPGLERHYLVKLVGGGARQG